MSEDLAVFGWAWFEVFMDQVVNDGISYGPRKPELDSHIEGVSFTYLELYAKKESLNEIEWKWT